MEIPTAAAHLLAQQDGVISRSQALAAGFDDPGIKRLRRRREWVSVHPGVYVNHTGPLTWQQRAWAAVLAVSPAALGGRSALRAWEGPGAGWEEAGPIEIIVPRERNVRPPLGVVATRVTRFYERVHGVRQPPRQRLEDAAITVAARASSDLEAIAVVAGLVQGRRTTAARLAAALAERGRTRRGRWLAGVLDDVAEGACSVLEHGYLNHVERAHGLPRAHRQRQVGTTLGMVYRDVSYADLVVELDGRLFHDTARQRDRDLDRDLEVALSGQLSVRLSYGQVFDRSCATAGRIAALLIQRGWAGPATRCGPGCQLPEW
ncbi:type IV toxin-antitoxin system AbiEi family antitoxin domain-containing protein [Nocardioides limicola]|uniref:type IV toxin-antitoxin system AbiEi family antitoxin domain-containing protein n=1 Tax=Nocardioides limicola TaxID=2803368 RepID=UPI00193C3BD4|nr:type IV toxin-antitoxin system AbiEi family antitoxin domain-containing protein [Nocardioides sp. DJM-14]